MAFAGSGTGTKTSLITHSRRFQPRENSFPAGSATARASIALRPENRIAGGPWAPVMSVSIFMWPLESAERSQAASSGSEARSSRGNGSAFHVSSPV